MAACPANCSTNGIPSRPGRNTGATMPNITGPCQPTGRSKKRCGGARHGAMFAGQRIANAPGGIYQAVGATFEAARRPFRNRIEGLAF